MRNTLSGFKICLSVLPILSLFMLSLFILSLFIIGGCTKRTVPVCSQVPVPCAFHLSTQQKMQAVYHWGLLAGDVAGLVKKKIGTNYNDIQASIYVVPSGLTPFEKAFHKFLVTRLVEYGLNVSNNSKGNMHLSFDIQLINHSQRIIRGKAGFYKSLAPGFFVRRDISLFESAKKNAFAESLVRAAEVNTEAGMYMLGPPGNELLITSSLMYDNKYIMRDSSVYYINDPEWSHYVQAAKFQNSISVVQYKIVDE